jgi:mono/diheme cytochrome c family protein
MAIAVSASTGVGLGRTSHRLRNAANAPPAWAAPYVAAAAGKKAAEVKPVAVDLGDRIGLLRPIPTGQGCLRCHGPAEGLTPGVRDALSRGYPADQATGFAEGDLRGFFWAEASR